MAARSSDLSANTEYDATALVGYLNMSSASPFSECRYYAVFCLRLVMLSYPMQHQRSSGGICYSSEEIEYSGLANSDPIVQGNAPRTGGGARYMVNFLPLALLVFVGSQTLCLNRPGIPLSWYI